MRTNHTPTAPSTAKPRLESDSLGELEVPGEALYGARTQRALGLAVSQRCLGDLDRYVRALGAVKWAAARANGAASVIDETTRNAIERAAAQVARGEVDPAHFPVDPLTGGGSIAVNTNVNEVVANLANVGLGRALGLYDPIHPRRDVNASQSTADVCHTAGRLAVLDAGTHLDGVLATLSRTLHAVTDALTGTPTLGRTCLRDALPVSAGLLFDGATAAVERDRRSLAELLEPLALITLGATVLGTGTGAPPAYRSGVVRELTFVSGFASAAHPDPASALQHGDDLVRLSGALAGIGRTLAKLAADLRLLSSGPRGGFGELVLPQVMEGSTFFDDKTNPVVPETVLQAAAQVAGYERTVQAAAERAELHLQVFEGLVLVNVLDAATLLARSAALFDTACLRGITADASRRRELADLVR